LSNETSASIDIVRQRVVLFVFVTAFLDLIGFGIILAAAFLVGVAIFGAGFGMTLPLLSSLASRAATEESRGFVLGMALGGAAAALLCAVVGATLRNASRPSS
jgi:hypothetical protein